MRFLTAATLFTAMTVAMPAPSGSSVSAAPGKTLGFATYKEIRDGEDNSEIIAYEELPRSKTIFLYIQIIPGRDHSKLEEDFRTLCDNYGPKGVAVIPRVRYGNTDGSIRVEPKDSSLILSDVAEWASIFRDVASSGCNIPVVQTGFLGMWGEWHSGPLCDNLDVKRNIVKTLQTSGLKVALRYPRDHKDIFNGDRSATIHNDCIFNGGPKGYDGGTFPDEDRQTWVNYTKKVASGNTYGGEGCNQADDSTYDWSNYKDLCGSKGIIPYINEFQIAYLNPGNPEQMQSLFDNEAYSDCVDKIQAALESHQ